MLPEQFALHGSVIGCKKKHHTQLSITGRRKTCERPTQLQGKISSGMKDAEVTL